MISLVCFLRLRASAIPSFRTSKRLPIRTLALSASARFLSKHSDFPRQQQTQQPQQESSNQQNPPAAAASSLAFLADRKFEQSLRHFSQQEPQQRNQGTRKASGTLSNQRINGTANRADSTVSSSSSSAAPSQRPPYTLQRKMHGKNRIAVLYPPGSRVVTLDLSIEAPTTTSKEKVTATSVVKSMAREEQEAASKTLGRIRLLFTPPRPKGQVPKRHSREELLASCPTVRVYGLASEVDAAAKEDFSALVAPGSVEAKFSFTENEAEGEVVLYRELNTELPNRVFWKYARVLLLNESTKVRIFYNVPTITSISSPGVPYVGLPLVCPSISLLFAKEENICYEWCVFGEEIATSRGGKTEEALRHVVSHESTFSPTPDLIGKHMMIRVSLDSATGLWTELRLPDVVQPLPPSVSRWQETKTPVSSPAFRAVTYNILYDDFCTSKSSKAKIYPFATDAILNLENRKVRIVQELLAYHADLVCLQECGRDVFQSYLLPVMKAAGYDGVYMNKAGSVKEGCGFLFRQSRYEVVHADSIPLNFATLSARHADVAERVGTCPELKEALSAVTTIGARLVLRDVASNREILVGNTHLFYHANACHIRILQAYMLLYWLYTAAVAVEAGAEASVSPGAVNSSQLVRPVVLCGDFNCTHTTGAYRLLTTGQVEERHHSWEKGKLFWWGCSRLLGCDAEQLGELLGENTVLPQARVPRNDSHRSNKKMKEESASLTGLENEAEETDAAAATPVRGSDYVVTKVFRETFHAPPLHLQDAYQRMDPSLPWTNFTLTFREVIDYIFFSSDSIEVLRTVPIPPESELTENFALPNEKYPSDHVALIADLSFKQ